MNFIKQTLAVVITGIILFLLLEIFWRGTRAIVPLTSQYIDSIGEVRIPDFTYIFFNEGFGMGAFNEGHYLGSYYKKNKPDDVVRIALHGDSYIEGLQVFQRNHFASVLENELNSASINTQVLNFGRADFDVEDMAAYSILFTNYYDSDYTIFFICNDRFEIQNTHALNPCIEVRSDSIAIDYQNIDQNVLTRYKKFRPFLRHSYTLNMIQDCYVYYQQGLLGSKIFGKYYDRYKKYSNTETNVAASSYEYQTTKIDGILKYYSKLPGVILVNRSQEALDDEILHMIDKYDLPLIDLSSTLEELHASGIDPKFWNASGTRGHWNNDAHRSIGKFLATELSMIIQKDNTK